MWRKFLIDYFTFTRKERTAIITILIAILALWFLPEFFESTDHKLSAIQIAEIKAESVKLEQSLQERDSNEQNYFVTEAKPEIKSEFAKKIPARKLFEFDPNTLSMSGWKSLGLKERTIATIQNYLTKGGHFKTASDLGKIYGLNRIDYEQLLPYVRIHVKGKDSLLKMGYAHSASIHRKPMKTFSLPSGYKLDINTADSADWDKLPGIGPKLSVRIISFRKSLGGFYDVGQVAEIYGLADSVFQKIKYSLMVAPGFMVTKININKADIKTLQSHPYIRVARANAIVQYRTQHGLFSALEDVLKIGMITREWLEHVKPYFSI